MLELTLRQSKLISHIARRTGLHQRLSERTPRQTGLRELLSQPGKIHHLNGFTRPHHHHAFALDLTAELRPNFCKCASVGRLEAFAEFTRDTCRARLAAGRYQIVQRGSQTFGRLVKRHRLCARWR